MATYTSSLKSWGGSGTEYPDGYSYEADVPPVDVYDDFLTSNLINDVKHLVSLTNDRIEADKGATGGEPASPETSHLFHDQGNERLEVWDASKSAWYTHLRRDGDTMAGALDMGGYQIHDATGTLSLGGVVNASGTLKYGGSEVLTTSLEGSGNGLNADTVDGKHANELGVDMEENGSVVVSSSTGLNATTDLDMSDDGDGTVTLKHADTSTQGNVSAAAGAAITDVNLDGRGHVTSLSTTDFDGRYDNYGSFTFEEGDGESTAVGSGERAVITGGGGLNTELTSTSPPTISVRHNNTSAQGDVTTGGATVIDDIYTDGYGHVDNINTENRSLDDWQDAGSPIGVAVYASTSDLPSGSEGDIAYVSGQNDLYVYT